MNARIKKKRSKRAYSQEREVIHEILDLVLDINGLQESAKVVTGDHPTAFFSFAGHIGTVEVEVDTHGWVSGANHDKWLRADVDRSERLRHILEELKELRC